MFRAPMDSFTTQPTGPKDAWIEQVRPRLAVISCGRHNSFGHPSPATVQRLQRHGVKVFRTDRDGAITLQLGPDGWSAAIMVHAK